MREAFRAAVVRVINSDKPVQQPALVQRIASVLDRPQRAPKRPAR